MLGSVTLVRNLQRRPGYRWRWHCGDCSHSVWTRTWSWEGGVQSAGQSVWSCETAPGHKSSPATVWMRWLCDCVCVLTALQVLFLSSWFYSSLVSFGCLKLVLYFLWFLIATSLLCLREARQGYHFTSSYDGVLSMLSSVMCHACDRDTKKAEWLLCVML